MKKEKNLNDDKIIKKIEIIILYFIAFCSLCIDIYGIIVIANSQ